MNEVKNPTLGKDGMSTFYIQLTELSRNHQDRLFVLHVSVDSSVLYGNIPLTEAMYVPPVLSNAMRCIRHRLMISEEHHEPFAFYKDEGGREKCIRLEVSLRDANNAVVTNRRVKLSIVLCYEDGAVVGSQDILHFSQDTRPMIEPHNTIALINYRINEVSKSHRGKRFKLRIGADTLTNPEHGDIAEAFTVPVNVLSKRNNPSKRSNPSVDPPETARRPRLNPSKPLVPGFGEGSCIRLIAESLKVCRGYGCCSVAFAQQRIL